MKKALGLIGFALVFAAPAHSGGKSHQHYHYGKGDQVYNQGGTQIVVSCFRGPWRDVIWDRPNAVFVDSLVEVGYDFPTAHAIAERVCRDDALVGNSDAMRSTMLRIYYDAASHRRHNR